MRLGASATPDELPHWAWQIVGTYDRRFSVEQKQDVPIEAGIILRK